MNGMVTIVPLSVVAATFDAPVMASALETRANAMKAFEKTIALEVSGAIFVVTQ
jgi:hypothetical protein